MGFKNKNLFLNFKKLKKSQKNETWIIQKLEPVWNV